MSTRHITIRVTPGGAIEESIDDAITQGLRQLREKHKESMELVNVSSMHQPHNGMIFVTVIAKGTGQVAARAVKPREAKKQ